MADGQTIESLQIEVQAQATTAKEALENLKKTLSNLKKVTSGGCGLSSIADDLSKLDKAASSINASGAGKIIALCDALKHLKGLGKFDGAETFNITHFISEMGTVASLIPADAGTKIAQLGSGISFLSGIDKVKIPATLGKNITDLATSVSTVPADTATKLLQIGNGLQGLAGVKDIKISSTIANNLMNVAIAVEQMDNVNFTNLEKLATGLSSLKGLTISAAASNNLTKLGESAAKLNGMDFSGFQKLAQSLAPISAQMTTLGQTLPNISKQLGEVSVQANKAAVSNNKMKDSTVNLYAGLMLAYKSISKVARAIASLIDKSNSFIEDYNLFNASMGKYAEEAEEYARLVGDVMGIDPGKWMRNQGIFQTLATGFGIASDRAYIMSKNLTQLGYDLSSFFNIATEGEGGSMQKLQAGLAGELEPLRRLGFDLSEARLKAIALSLGIDQTYKSMSQAEKAQLRYYAIMTQVTTAQTDMARTLDTPANQLRILKAQVEQAGRAFGNVFIPALNAVLPYAIAVANALRILAETLASFFGFTLPEVDYSGIDTTLSTAADASEDLDDGLKNSAKSATKLKHLLADWDELNIIQTESESGGGSGKTKKKGEDKTFNPDDWKWELPQYDFLNGLVKSRADAILKQMKPALDWVKENLDNIIDLAEGVGAALVGWKLSSKLFPGLMATGSFLQGLLASVGAIAVEFATIALNVHFTADFLDSDGNELEWGALFGGIISNVAGSTLFGKLVESALGEGTGIIGTGASFIINGLVTLNMGINDLEAKKQFTAQNVITIARGVISNALGTSFVAGKLLSNKFGGALKLEDKIMLGVAAFALSANVAMNMAITRDVLNDGHENIPETLLKTGTNILSDAMTALGAGYSVSRLLGEKAGWTVAGVTLALDSTMSLTLGAEDAATEGFDADNISTMIKGALEGASVGWLFGHMIFPGHEKGLAGAALVASLGVAMSVYGTTQIAESEEDFSWEGWLLKGLGDIVTVGGTSLIIGKTFGLSKSGMLTVAGAALAVESALNLVTTFGKATREGWSYQTLTSALFDELGAAIGLGVIMTSLFGVAAPVTLAIVGGALVATAAVTMVLALNSINADAKKSIQVNWGESELSEEEIKQKVNSYFKYDVEAHIESIKLTGTIEAIRTVNQSLGKAQKFINGIRIGVNKEQSYTDMKNLLIGEDGAMGPDTLIGQMKALIHENAATVTDFISLGDLDKKDISLVGLMTRTDQNVTTELTTAGETWGKYFSQGFESVASEAANNLLTYILEITQAATRGQREAEFQIAFGNLGLGNMTKETAMNTIKSYLELEEEAKQHYIEDQNKAFIATMSSYNSLKATIDNWSLAHDTPIPESYLKDLKDYEARLFGVDKNGNFGTSENPFEGSLAWDIRNGYTDALKLHDKDMASSRQMIGAELTELYSGAISDGLKNVTRGAWDQNIQREMVEALFDYQDDPSTLTDAKEKMSAFLMEVLKTNLPEDEFSTLKSAFDGGILNIFDLFKDVDFSSIKKQVFRDYDPSTWNEMGGVLEELWKKILGGTNPKAPALDTKDAVQTLNDWKQATSEATTEIKQNIDSVGSMSVDWNVSWGRAPRIPKVVKKADGGFVNTGDMFVAREAGPELVGRIGRRTAVANNDQIVTSVSEGVATGQREQTNLLRQQNDLLRQLLNKEFSTKVVPDSQWGRFNRECERLYARNTGR